MEKQYYHSILTDEQLIKLLDKKEGGKSFALALEECGLARLSKDEYLRIEELWEMHTTLKEKALAIFPPLALPDRFVGEVSALENNGSCRQAIFSFGQKIHILAHRRSFLSWMHWRIALPALVLALFMIVVLPRLNDGTSRSIFSAQTPPPEAGVMASNEGNPLRMVSETDTADMTGKIASILSTEATGERGLLADAGEDVALVGAPSQSINDLHRSYEEKTAF